MLVTAFVAVLVEESSFPSCQLDDLSSDGSFLSQELCKMSLSPLELACSDRTPRRLGYRWYHPSASDNQKIVQEGLGKDCCLRKPTSFP